MIKYFNIDDNDSQLPILKQHVHNPKNKVFLFIYLDGCHPCNQVKPIWDQIPHFHNSIQPKNENVIVAKINQKHYPQLDLGPNPPAYPSIFHFLNMKKKNEIFPKQSPMEFIKWINVNLKKKPKTRKRRKIRKKSVKKSI